MIGLTQLCQNFDGELMRWKCVCPQVLRWKREGIHCQGQGVQHWRHKGLDFGISPGGEQVLRGRSPQGNMGLMISRLSLVLVREEIGHGVHLPWDVDHLQ